MMTPATRTSAIDFLPRSAAVVQRQLTRNHGRSARAYELGLAACRRRLSFHAVHRLRIAIRRLLAGLELWREIDVEIPAVRRALRRQARALGKLRDAQVQLGIVEDQPSATRLLEPLRQDLLKRRRRHAKEVRQVLKSDKARRRLERWNPTPPAESLRPLDRLGILLDRRRRNTERSLVRLKSTTPIELAAVHRVRVEARKYRYAIEALRANWRGAEAANLLSSLRAFHQVVGQLRDRELLVRRVDRLIADQELPLSAARIFRALAKSERARLHELLAKPPSESR